MNNDSNVSISSSGERLSGGPDTGRSNASGAAKVFKEFKWGLLTLFLLMVVVIGLVYDGGPKKGTEKEKKEDRTAELLESHEVAPGGEGTLDPTALHGQSLAGMPAGGTGSGALGQGTIEKSPVQGLGSEGKDTMAPPVFPSRPPDFNDPTQTAPESLKVKDGQGLVKSKEEPKEKTSETLIKDEKGAPSKELNAEAKMREGSMGAMKGATLNDLGKPKDASLNSYTIQPGDNLTKIARKFYPGKVNKGIKILSESNKHLFNDPNQIHAGMVLIVPELAETPSPTTSPKKEGMEGAKTGGGEKEMAGGTKVRDEKSSGKENLQTVEKKEPSQETEETYVVKAGDSLEAIARRLYKDGRKWKDLYEWNRDKLADPSSLRAGQVLLLKKPSPTAKENPEAGKKGDEKATLAQVKVERKETKKEVSKDKETAEEPLPLERLAPTLKWMP